MRKILDWSEANLIGQHYQKLVSERLSLFILFQKKQ